MAAPTAGGKAANLGELIGAGFPVPPGFVLPASSYLQAVEAAGVRGELAELHVRALGAAEDPATLGELCGRMAELIRKTALPLALADSVRAAYAGLPGGAALPRCRRKESKVPGRHRTWRRH
jgi:pyruvate,water dikinase